MLVLDPFPLRSALLLAGRGWRLVSVETIGIRVYHGLLRGGQAGDAG